MQSVTTIINARWIVPIEPEGVLENHAIVIADGRILEILPQREIHSKYTSDDHLDLPYHILIPGLINAHTHAAMSLLRGLADDLPLMEWLHQHIWPAETRWADAEFVHDGTQLAMAEMLRGGVTCFNDMYFFPEVTAAAVRTCGMRACIGLINIDFPSAWARDAEEYLAKGLALHDSLREIPRLHTAFAPHAPYTVSETSLERIRRLAEQLAIPVHMHVHETKGEVETSIEQHGHRPLSQLDRLGLLSKKLAAVHMTQLNVEEIERIAETGVNVVHCPESNLKLASGFCPVAKLDTAGVNVALGTDGAASNNDLNLLGEMRTAALLGKGIAQDATALPAHRVLRMATLNGAHALGLDAEIGSLQPGKAADITAIDLNLPETQPVYDPISQLVYASSRQQVTNVWVAGQRLLKDRLPTTLDLDYITHKASQWRRNIGN